MGIGEQIGCNVGENIGSSGRNIEEPFAGTGISSVSGTISDGSTLTISGGGFGAKTTAAPHKWDDFESGTLGEFLSDEDADWSERPLYGPKEHVYSDNRAYKGSQSAYKFFDKSVEGSDFSASGMGGLNTTKLYFNMYIYHNVPSGIGKMIRVHAPSATWYEGHPYFVISNIDTIDFAVIQGSGATEYYYSAPVPSFNQWWNLEIWYDLGTQGVADGRFIVKVNGTTLQLRDSVGEVDITKQCWNTGDDPINSILLPGMVDSQGTHDCWWNVDLFYLDTTPMRVVVGNADTYDACTTYDPQPATTWSDTQITVTGNLPNHSTTDTIYFYVIDDDNNPIDTNGYPKTVE